MISEGRRSRAFLHKYVTYVTCPAPDPALCSQYTSEVY